MIATVALMLPAALPAGEIEQLRDALLASDSATALLARRCGAPIRAEVARGVTVAPGAARRARLQVAADEPVAYRSVRLMCGTRVLSLAQNWYVPARLTPAMNAALQGDTPFGAVIRPLAPRRRTLGVEILRRPADSAAAETDEVLRVQALVVDAQGRPLAEVVEGYTAALLALPPR